MDVSGSILANLDTGNHTGMTKISIFIFCGRAQDHEHFVEV